LDNIIFHQFRHESALGEYLSVVVAVGKCLRSAVASNSYIRVAVKAGHLLAETSGQTAIFDSYHHFVVGLEALKQLLVDARQEAWVNERGIYAGGVFLF
jgi:hypothetical protein